MSDVNQISVRLLGTTISLRPKDTRLETVVESGKNCQCTHCRQCYCRSCGRLSHPELSSEEVITLFQKVA